MHKRKNKMAELKAKTFKVIKDFTLDKNYRVGSLVELSDKKTIEKLITNKFIK